jgi:hypothetical protein
LIIPTTAGELKPKEVIALLVNGALRCAPQEALGVPPLVPLQIQEIEPP